MAATVTRFQATQKGGPFVLASIPKPTPGPNEVSIRLKAIGLNPLDWKQFYFGIMVESWPAAFGIDGAGVVEAVGQAVTRFETGDEVFSLFGHGSKTAAFQEIAVVPEHFVAKKPGNATLEEAASLPRRGHRPPTEVHPVLGGSSGVGASAIQILRLALPSATILTKSSPQHHTRLTTLGATKAFDQKSPALVADIKSATPRGEGVDVVVDAVGSGATRPDIFDTLRAAGPKEYAEVLIGAQIQCPEGVKRHVVLGRKIFETQGGGNAMSALADLISQGKYKIPFQAVKRVESGLEAIGPGLDELKRGVSGTKLVVTI